VRATGHTRDQLCLACITGKYPTPLAQKMADGMKEKFFNGYEEKEESTRHVKPHRKLSDKTN
jgi:hypothetical protein